MLMHRMPKTSRFVRPAFVALALGTASNARALEPAVDSGLGWTMTSMDLDIRIQPKQETVSIEGKARLRLNQDVSMGPTIWLNARDEVMRFTHVAALGGVAVTINDPVPNDPHTLTASVRYPDALSRGAEVEISFACKSSKNSMQFHVSDKIAAASWVEAWYPLPYFDQNDDTISLSSVATLRGTTRFHLPKEWRSVSNGAFVGRRELADSAVETWHVTTAAARSFAAGPYTMARHTIGDSSVGVYLLSQKRLSANEQAETLAKSIEAMEARFGPYPYPSYSIAEVPDGVFHWYSSSEQGFIMSVSRAFAYDGGNLPLFAHEAAHGWWGNLVGSHGPGGILCSESLAQYSAVVAIESIEGERAATEFLRFSREGYNPIQCARGYFEMMAGGQDKPLSELSSGGWEHNLSDAKGHWFYHMLRRRVGDGVFFATLRNLIKEHGNAEAMSLEDLRSSFLSATSDSLGLTRFFAQWLDRTGAPVLDVQWERMPEQGAHKAKVNIRQSQDGEPYALKVDVAVDSDKGRRLHVVDLDQRETLAILEADGVPTGVTIDPDHRLLIWTPEYGPRPGR